MTRKIKLFIFGISLFAPYYIIAQTNISGLIDENTIWSKDHSPYHITGNTLIKENIQLLIEPGVRILFDSNYSIQIDGELIAAGTDQNKIYFSSNMESPAPGDWGRLFFTHISKGSTFNEDQEYIDGCSMRHCIIEYGGSDTQTGMICIEKMDIYTANGIYLNNCEIKNSQSSGIYLDRGKHGIDSCIIVECSQNAIYIHRLLHDLTIQASHFLNNHGSLVYLNYSENHPHLKVLNNTFQDNIGGTIIYMEMGFFMVSNNEFINNSEIDYIIKSDYPGNGSQIFHNTFYNNGILENAICMDGTNSTDEFTIEMNCFSSNQSDNALIYIHGSSGADNLWHINDNSFTSNQIKDLNQPLFNLEGHHIFFKTEIFYNEFSGNVSNSLFSIDKFSGGIHYNNITNNSVAFLIENKTPAGQPTIDASLNYWGSTGLDSLREKIWDWFDNGDLTIIFVDSLLENPVTLQNDCANYTSDNSSLPRAEGNSFKVFPNPITEDHLYIKVYNHIFNTYISIYNQSGSLVYSNYKAYISSELNLDLSKLPAGIYFLVLYTEGNFHTKKIVKI